MHTAARGRVIFTGRVIVDLTMDVDKRPKSGSEGFARDFAMEVGGGYHLLNTARRLGVTAEYAGGTGTGPLGDVVRQAMHYAGIITTGYMHPSLDTGFRVSIKESDQIITRLNTRGAEVKPPKDAFADVHVGTGDVIVMSGYTLYEPESVEAALGLIDRVKQMSQRSSRAELPHPITILEAGALLPDLSKEVLDAVAELHPVWTKDMSEARMAARQFGMERAGAADERDVCAFLSDALDSIVVVRTEGGTWIADGATPRFLSVAKEEIQFPGRLNTIHVGTLAAELALGADLEESVAWANAAAMRAATIGGLSEAISRQNVAPMVAKSA